MNENMIEEESPDHLDEGIKKRNFRPLIIGAVAAGLLLAGLAIAAYVRAERQQDSNRVTAETYKITSPAVPPIKRPEGPDVSFPVAPVEVANVVPGEVQGMSEAERQAQQRRIAALEAAYTSKPDVEGFSRRNPAMTQPPYPGIDPVMPGMGGLIPPPPPQRDEEGQQVADPEQQKRAFLSFNSEGGSPYLKHTREDAISPYVVTAGSVIPGVLLSGISSVLPGQITGQVRQNVYDSATGRHLLIPAGARIVGSYDSSISAGQERIFVAWNRIIFPDSSYVFLDAMPGADQIGMAGFQDQVNNHYVRTFGQAFLLSLFSAGIQLSQPRPAVQGTFSATQIGAAAVGQQLGQLGMQIARQNLNMRPTLEIRPGFNFTIAVNKDMVLKPWTGHHLAKK